jgi:hypothetical protein
MKRELVRFNVKALMIEKKAKENTKPHFVAVVVPVRPNYMADSRTVCVVENWVSCEDAFSYYPASSFASQGRDKAVDFILNETPSVTHVLFVDSDVIPDARSIDRLLEADKDIAVGACPIVRNGSIVWNVNPIETKPKSGVPESFDGMPFNGLPEKPFRVHTYGFGLVLVKRNVFEEMEWPYWKDEFVPGRRTIGQDVYFALKSDDAGFESWCVPSVKCEHNKHIPLKMLADKVYK